MTYLEKYKQDHPFGLINNSGIPGGMVCHCPYNYDYEDVGNYLGCPHKDIDCVTCWNREMPEEPKKTKYIRIAVDEDTYSDIVNGAETTHIVVGPENVVESEPVKCNDVCENITPELVADLRTRVRVLESENATLKECIIRMTLRMNELY